MRLLIRHFLTVAGIIFIFLVCTSFVGLRVSKVTFTGFFGNDSLKQNKNYFSTALVDSIAVSTCRFYVSDFRLYSGNSLVAKQDYKLIDVFEDSANYFVT